VPCSRRSPPCSSGAANRAFRRSSTVERNRSTLLHHVGPRRTRAGGPHAVPTRRDASRARRSSSRGWFLGGLVGRRIRGPAMNPRVFPGGPSVLVGGLGDARSPRLVPRLPRGAPRRARRSRRGDARSASVHLADALYELHGAEPQADPCSNQRRKRSRSAFGTPDQLAPGRATGRRRRTRRRNSHAAAGRRRASISSSARVRGQGTDGCAPTLRGVKVALT